MGIKSKIMAFFGKIRNFNILYALLEQKTKTLEKCMGIDAEKINYYKSKIFEANLEIQNSLEEIEDLEKNITKTKKRIADINKVIL